MSLPLRFLLLSGLFAALVLVAPAVHADPAHPDPTFGAVEAFWAPDQAVAAGVGWQRIVFPWNLIQPTGPDSWNAGYLPDFVVAHELAEGREIVGLLIGTPGWAEDGVHGTRSVPRGLDLAWNDPGNTWGQFVYRIVERYKGRIDRWIVWNEPDVWDETHAGHTWAGTEKDYARLLRVAYRAARAGNPGCKLHLAGLTYWWDAEHGRRPYLPRLLNALAAEPEAKANGYFFDVATVHAYFDPENVYNQVQFVRRSLAAHGLNKPIWINETNAPPADDPQNPVATPRFPLTLEEQAAFIVQSFAMGLAAGAERIAVYKMIDVPGVPPGLESFGLLHTDGSPRPAYLALKTATTHFSGVRRATLRRVGLTNVVVLDRGDRTTTVAWNRNARATQLRLNARASAATLVDVKGQETAVRPTAGVYRLTLPGTVCSRNPCLVGGQPILLIEDLPRKK